MSHKGGKMESVRMSINEHMTSVGEEMLCVLDKQQRGSAVCSVKLDVRVFVLERLGAAAEFMCNLFQREMETLETLLEKQNKLLEAILQPNIKLHRAEVSSEHEEMNPSLVQEEPHPPQIKEEQEEEAVALTLLHNKTWFNTLSDIQHLPVCKEEVSPEEERSPSLVQVEPGPPYIKEEKEEILQRPEEVNRPMLTLLAVKSENDDGENRETEPVASSSTEHMKTQVDVVDCGASLPTSDEQHLSSHCSESDITEDSDEWETNVDQSPLNTLKSHKTHRVEGQRLSLRNKMSKDLTSSTETHSMRSHTGEKGFSCTVCDKLFKQKGNLVMHMRTHTGETPFTCTVCDKLFKHKGNLVMHMRTHTGEMPFTCTVCDKRFKQKGSLISHMRTHTGEMPFTCTVCDKLFKHKGNLVKHMRTHTGETPFTCTVCDKLFKDKGNLVMHMRTHTGEMPFTCTVCDKRFKQKGSLIVHMRTHTGETPFTCTVCDKLFKHKGNLVKHMRTHTGETPFTCTVCGLYIQKGQLKIHMRTHTGGKPFTCNVCSKGFVHSNGLKIHMMTHTQIYSYAEKLLVERKCKKGATSMDK